MKNQILDELTRDSFADYLKKGETILWQDHAVQPDFVIVPANEKFWNFHPRRGVKIFLYLCLVFLCFFLMTRISLYIVGGIFILGIIFIFVNKRKTIHQAIAEYAITSNRILFKSNISKKRKILQISFSEIQNCLVVKNKNGRGTVFLIVKNPALTPFDTYAPIDDESIERRHQPTLENLENPDKVAELIRQGIKQNN